MDCCGLKSLMVECQANEASTGEVNMINLVDSGIRIREIIDFQPNSNCTLFCSTRQQVFKVKKCVEANQNRFLHLLIST